MAELHPYLSPTLTNAGFRHGFFGRVGGHSKGVFTSLNCSYSVGDDATNVTLNLTSVAAHFGLLPNRLVAASQVHGCAVLDADGGVDLEQLRASEGDALVGASNAYALCIRTADCVPILIGCRTTGMAAAVHAGWRGVVKGVVPAAVTALIAKGAEPESLVAAVGPHIGPNHFEVSLEIAQELDACAPEAKAVCEHGCGRPTVRLASLVVAQLMRCGVAEQRIDAPSLCTFSKSDEFFSYRRDGAESGRELSVIVPRGRPR